MSEEQDNSISIEDIRMVESQTWKQGDVIILDEHENPILTIKRDGSKSIIIHNLSLEYEIFNALNACYGHSSTRTKAKAIADHLVKVLGFRQLMEV